MGDDTVTIRFGAKIEELVEGVHKVREQIEGLGESAKHLAEIFGIAFTAEKILEFVHSMAELGLATERSMAILGISAEKVGELQGIAKLTGTSFDELQGSIGRMTLRLQESTRNAFNPTAEGLKALGINARDLIGIPTDQYMLRLAEAFGKFNPSLNLTTAAQAAFGRGISQQLPLLLQGKEHFEELQHAVAATGSELSGAAAKGFAESHEKMTLLGMSMQGLGIKIFTVMKPALDKAVEGLTHLVQTISSGDIQGAVVKIGNAMISVGEQIALFFIGVDEAIKKIIATMRSEFAPQLGAFAEFVAGSLGKTLEIVMLGLNKMAETVAGSRPALNVAGKAIDEITAAAERYRKAAEAAATASRKMLEEAMKPLAIHAEDAEKKTDVPTMNVGGKEELAAQIAAIQTRIRLAGEEFSRVSEGYEHQVKIFGMTESQKTELQRAALLARFNEELAALSDEQALAGLTKAEYQKVLNERLLLRAKYEKEDQKLRHKGQEDEIKTWESDLGQIQSAWDSQFRGLLSKTTTFAQAMKNVFADLILLIIKEFEKIVIVETLAKAMQSLFGDLDLTGIFKAMAANIALTYTAATAYFTPILGPAAPAAGAAVAAIAGAGIGAFLALPAAEQGAWNIPSTSPWLLHKGEMVLPANLAENVRGGGSGGSGGSIVIHAMDGASVLRVVNEHAAVFARVLQGHATANPTSHG